MSRESGWSSLPSIYFSRNPLSSYLAETIRHACQKLSETLLQSAFFWSLAYKTLQQKYPGWNPDPQVSLKDGRIFCGSWLINWSQPNKSFGEDIPRASASCSLPLFPSAYTAESGHNIIILTHKLQFNMFTHCVVLPITLITGLESLFET